MSCSGTQKSDASEAQTHGPSVSSQTLCQCATVLPIIRTMNIYGLGVGIGTVSKILSLL